jgi:hypothetical protein
MLFVSVCACARRFALKIPPQFICRLFIRSENDTVSEKAIANKSSHGEAKSNDSEDTAVFTIEAKVRVSNDNTNEGMVEKDDNPSPTKKVKVDDETNVEEKDGSTYYTCEVVLFLLGS